MKKNFTFGIVGFGKIGPRHKEKIEENNHCTLKAICDIDKTVLNKIEDDKVKLYQDYYEMLNRDDIDIVSVCTPNYLHKDIIIDALNTGKHVMCEKPLAMNLAEAREILDAANAHPELVSQITFEYRYQPAMMRAKKLIEEGLLGRVFSVRIAYLHSGYIDSNRPISWRLTKEYGGGGALYDLSSHVIDITRFFLGDFRKVFARLETFIPLLILRA